MSKIDLKKNFKQLYTASAEEIAIVDVPPLHFLMAEGKGDPNTVPAFQHAIETLFRLSYAIKFMLKKEQALDYVVMPLEGLWWADDPPAFTEGRKDEWQWTLMIQQPGFVSRENVDAAMEQVEEILRLEKARGFGGTIEPFRIWLTCYRVLKSCQDPRAGEVLAAAYERLQAQRSNIHDKDLERTFVENVAAHRELIAAYTEWRALGQRTVRLPRADAPMGRPLCDGEYVTITWTVTAPEDEAVEDGPDRRQAQMRRLLQEAADQDAAPTVSDLATALAVSEPTVRRDLAALRRAGHSVQTRGSREG